MHARGPSHRGTWLVVRQRGNAGWHGAVLLGMANSRGQQIIAYLHADCGKTSSATCERAFDGHGRKCLS